MDTASHHLLIEFFECCPKTLDDAAVIEFWMRQAAEVSGATIVEALFHTFSPQGVTGVVLVEESHFSVHTWPEKKYAAVDVFTCGDLLTDKAFEVLKDGLQAKSWEQMKLARGRGSTGQGIQIRRHDWEARTSE